MDQWNILFSHILCSESLELELFAVLIMLTKSFTLFFEVIDIMKREVIKFQLQIGCQFVRFVNENTLIIFIIIVITDSFV